MSNNIIPRYTAQHDRAAYFQAKRAHNFWPLSPKVCEDEEDITGKVVIVTGANTGIGKETAYHLASRGAHVIMSCRDLERAQKAMEDILLRAPDAKIETMKLDLGSLDSVRNFVKEFQRKFTKLDILVNNAGYFNPNKIRETNKDGFETNMAVNHLGPFLLTRLLLDNLKAAAPSRIVSLVSGLVVVADLDLDDLMMEKLDWSVDEKEPYARAKFANLLCIMKLAQQLDKERSGVKVFQVNPGIVNSDLVRNVPGFFTRMFSMIGLYFKGLTVSQGCETSVYCSVAKFVAKSGGKGEIYMFREVSDFSHKLIKMDDPRVLRLYKWTEETVGIKD